MLPEDSSRFYLPKTMNRAKGKDRFVAHIIDMIVLSVLASFVINALGSMSPMVFVGLYYLYFILAHKIFGVTVGKQAMGIFLASKESTGLTWTQVILRETVWKWLAMLPLMYGYFRILITQEALHDKWARTTVVSQKKKEGSFVKAALVTFVMISIFSLSVYYILVHTPLVGHVVAKKLVEQGHVVRGLSGNLYKGWTVGYWKGQSPEGTYELSDVRFIYDVSQLFSNNTLRVQEVQVAKAVYHMNQMPLSLKKQKPIEEPKPSTNSKTRPWISKVIVDKINLNNIKVIRKGEPDIDVNRFYITSLSWDTKVVSLGQAYVEAPTLQLQLWDSKANFSTGDISLKSEFELRPGLHKSILKTIKGKAEFRGEIYNPHHVRVTAFDGRLNVYYMSNIFNLSVKSLTPSQYLRWDSRVGRITAEIKNNLCRGLACIVNGQSRGNFYHNNKKFAFQGSDVWPDGKGATRMKLQATSLFSMDNSTKTPLFSVTTNEEIMDFISDVYFSKTYYSLTSEEKTNVDKVSKDYLKYSNRSISSEKGALPSREDFNR